MPELLCIGHTTLDTFLSIENAEIHCAVDHTMCKVEFELGDKIPVESIHYGVGGGAANVAVGTKKLGVDSSVYSVVGDDPKGVDVKSAFEVAHIGIDHLYMDKNPTDQSTVLSYNRERNIFTYNYPRVYKLSAVDKIPNNIYLSSIGADVRDFYNELAAYKEVHPYVSIFYNPGSRELGYAIHDIRALMPSVDYLLCNVEEGCRILNDGLKRDQVDIQDLLNLLLEKGITNVVLTDAENGMYVSNEEGTVFLPAIKTDVVEKTGAGDAFAAGFIAAVLSGYDLKTALKWGRLNSSSAIQVVGAQNGLLSKDEMLAQV